MTAIKIALCAINTVIPKKPQYGKLLKFKNNPNNKKRGLSLALIIFLQNIFHTVPWLFLEAFYHQPLELL